MLQTQHSYGAIYKYHQAGGGYPGVPGGLQKQILADTGTGG